MIYRNTYARLLVAAVLVASCGNSPSPDAVVAKVGDTAILYRKIRCSPKHRPDAQRCTAIEQDNLDRRIMGMAVEAAAEVLNVPFTAEDAATVEAKVAEQRDMNVQSADRMKRLLQAAVRVHSGENAEDVRQEMVGQGYPREEVDEIITRFPTVADAEEALAIDFIGTGERSIREWERRAILRRRLHAAVAERARTRGNSADEAAAQVRREVLAHMQIQIVEERYHVPKHFETFLTPRKDDN